MTAKEEASALPAALLLTMPQVAELLNTSRSTAYRLVLSGALPSVRLAGVTRVAREDLATFVQQLREAGQR